MVLAEDLRQAVLQAALQGKLAEQLDTDSNVDEMLISIQEEKERFIAEKKIKKEKPLPEIQEDEIPFEIPDNWRWVKTGNICDCGAGATPPRTEKSYYDNGVIPWLKTGELTDGYIYKCEEKVTQLALDKCSLRVNQKNDILIAMYGATIGKLGIVTFPLTTNQACCGCTPYKGIYNLYLFYCFMSLKKILIGKAEGGAQPNISREKIRNLLIPLPPIEEQQRIVDKINEIMPKIDEYEKIEKELETLKNKFPNNMKDALFHAAMQGKLTEQLDSDSSVDELLASIKKGKKQLLKEKKIYKDKKLVEDVENKFDIDIPYNWRFVNLQEICTQITDGEHKTPNRVSEYQGYYLLSARNILNGKLILDDVDYVSKKEYDVISKRCNPHRNDILISCSGSVGRCCLINDDNNYVMVRSAAMIHCLQMNNKYIMYAIQSPYIQAQIDGLKKQSVQANLFQAAIASLLIPIPPIEEQQRIVERLDALLPLCEDLKK